MAKFIFHAEKLFEGKNRLTNVKKNYISFQRNGIPNNVVKRETPKFEQKPLGSYPVPPEAEMMWRNRHTAYGGYIQQTVSPFQQKIMYPFWHMAFARWWAKFSAYLWWWIWPFAITNVILYKMFYDAKKYVQQKHWY
ncbi:conserved Plasmodium protein, unknown function [Plasmodium ovale]|uniref:Uncharacterized protein n=2 Tax=Plasmodium ovale TaxID=36330 RepID=A0A1A8VU41_PLAOA|nr:conserved Plasmodium protein, unknown function [Plasmodium ovale curtisi]SBS90052.1 conserved Plasmodium protein, unknown function [Plasmodium ovale curtisi]SCP04325.1 conserved Plasmodium protein, unknown function [Plasmodium ovale]